MRPTLFMPKSTKDMTRKLDLISLVNIDAKMLVKFWQNTHTQYDKRGLIPGMQVCFNIQSINVIPHISSRCRKKNVQDSVSINDKSCQEDKNRR